jgi:hypothetical protein
MCRLLRVQPCIGSLPGGPIGPFLPEGPGKPFSPGGPGRPGGPGGPRNPIGPKKKIHKIEGTQ